MVLSAHNYKSGIQERLKKEKKYKSSKEVTNNCYTMLTSSCKASYFDNHRELYF